MRLLVEKLGYWPHGLVLLLSCFLVQCRPDVSIEQNTTEQAADTATVTSFNIERQNDHPALANWQVIEAGQEIICVPPGWKAHLADDATGGQDLVILPPSNPDSTERVTFTRIDKDSPKMNYNSFARQQAEAGFEGFTVQKGDSLTQLIFQRDFAYERSVHLATNGAAYRGYCMVYVNDRFLYIYRIILAEARLKAYQGDLIKDIIGNLQVNKQYLISNDNPAKKMVFIR